MRTCWVQGKSDDEIAKFSKLFGEIQQQIDTKQLRPMIRTQYLRTAFQIPFDSTVRISLDTNLTMIKENPDDGPTCTVAGRYAGTSKYSHVMTKLCSSSFVIADSCMALGSCSQMQQARNFAHCKRLAARQHVDLQSQSKLASIAVGFHAFRDTEEFHLRIG